eukprot:6707435-Pyramimonas_sp.AAC.2
MNPRKNRVDTGPQDHSSSGLTECARVYHREPNKNRRFLSGDGRSRRPLVARVPWRGHTVTPYIDRAHGNISTLLLEHRTRPIHEA